MARWRPRRTVKLVAHFREAGGLAWPVQKQASHERLSRTLEDQWSSLHQHCADESSHLRLGRLTHRLTHYNPGVRESALAELELATQLIRVGVRITFLPESQARTADLECRLGHERFFVEVTAMVGSSVRRRVPLRGIARDEAQGKEEDRGVILIHRILARIQQKAKQLEDYGDPVILHISIPRADLTSGLRARREEIWLDVKALSGAVTVRLMTLRHLSAVLISLWDVVPLPSKAGTRLANVELVERPKHQRTVPRVRMLIHNPGADAPLSERAADMCREML
ncbi:MAG: hypothetical protein OEY28_05575 [Nitrospira sp.]|nr:hypothetical protein [Nitrospira sp.]